MRIEIVSTGDELITGSIDDTNASFISRELIEVGLQVSRRHTVGDNLEELIELFTEISTRKSVVIVTGGLGPTNDDLTTEVAARVAKVPLELNEHWLECMRKWFAIRGRRMASTNLKQAMLPKGALFINNPIGTACGFVIKINHAMFIFAPGVPKELHLMWENSIKDLVLSFVPGEVPRTHLVRLFFMGIGESSMAELLNRIELPENITIGDRAIYPFVELKIIGNGADESDILNTLSKVMEILSPYYVSSDSYSFKDILHYHDITLPAINAIDGLCQGSFLMNLNQLFNDFSYCVAINTNNPEALSDEDKKNQLKQLEKFSEDNLLTILPYHTNEHPQEEVAKLNLTNNDKYQYHYELTYNLSFKQAERNHHLKGRLILSAMKSIYDKESYGRNREFLANLACVELYKLLTKEKLVVPEDMLLTELDNFDSRSLLK